MHAEALLIYRPHADVREMLYSEFMAILDGVIAVPELAGESAKTVYVQLDQQLNIAAMVFFHLPFDRNGQVNHDWNLPLRELAATGEPGPYINGQATRLVCRSQCDQRWHGHLWEPQDRMGRDPFTDMARIIRRNRLGLLPAEQAPVPPTLSEFVAPEPKARKPVKTETKADSDTPAAPTIADLQATLARLQQRDKQWQQKVRQLQIKLDTANQRAEDLAVSNEKLRAYLKALKAQYLKLKANSTEQVASQQRRR